MVSPDSISAKDRELLTELNERVRAVFGLNFCKLILYGSRARGGGDVDSDMDVLIVLRSCPSTEVELDRIDGVLNTLSLEYEVLIACKVASETDYIHSRMPLFVNIRREGVAL